MAEVKELLRIEAAAEMLGVPVESLRNAADRHGKTIRIGRAVRLHPDDIKELLDLCRVETKAPVSTGAPAAASGKSATPAISGFQLASGAARKLKQKPHSRSTSPAKGSRVVPFRQKN